MFVMVPRNCILDLILLTLRMNSFKMITIPSMSLSSRDKDGYYWLTGRVDDVINVRLVSVLPHISMILCISHLVVTNVYACGTKFNFLASYHCLF